MKRTTGSRHEKGRQNITSAREFDCGNCRWVNRKSPVSINSPFWRINFPSPRFKPPALAGQL
jgi:hypothetical protein